MLAYRTSTLCVTVSFSAARHERLLCSFVFFQAEDGIRDLVRSRGLGDVYKRQLERRAGQLGAMLRGRRRQRGALDVAEVAAAAFQPVSYTHLTLPTSDLV